MTGDGMTQAEFEKIESMIFQLRLSDSELAWDVRESLENLIYPYLPTEDMLPNQKDLKDYNVGMANCPYCDEPGIVHRVGVDQKANPAIYMCADEDCGRLMRCNKMSIEIK